MRATAGLAVLALVIAGCAVEPVADDGVADTAPAASSVPPASSASTIDSVSKPAGPGVEVESVVDGDTFDVFVDGAPERVRLIGIDMPEAGECLAEEAAVRLAELVATGEVRLVPDRSERDQFGRLLRYVDLDDGSSANTVLVAEGLALARSYPPDTARDHELARPSVAAF